MNALEKLAGRWLEEAETLARYRDTRGSEVCRLHAAEVRAALASHEKDVLTLAEAAEASGYSTDHLRHLVAEGSVPNAGKRGNPGIRRADLPKKPGKRRGADSGFDPDEEARKIAGRIGEAA